MSDSDDDVRSDDETLENKSGDAAKEADGDKPGDSLTTSETSDPRKAFMDQFTDTEVPPKGSEEDTEANADDDEGEPEDDVSASELLDDDKTVDEETADEDQQEDEEEDDEDIDDLGVDLDGIEGIDEDEDLEDEFNPRQDLNKKTWKATPKEAQQLITKFRRNYKKQQHHAETEKPFADWSRTLLTDAANAGMQTDDLMTFIDIGMRAHQGHPEAIEALGSRMVQNGYKPNVPTPDLSGVQDYLKTQVDSLEMDRDVAVKVLELVNGSVGSTQKVDGKEAAPAPAPRAPETRQPPGTSSTDLEAAALAKIQEIDARYQDRFGEDWNAIRKRVRREVTLEMAENPVSHAQWAKMWNQKAKAEAKAFVKRKKDKQSRSKLRSNSDSLERGASIALTDSGQELTGRDGFHKRHSR